MRQIEAREFLPDCPAEIVYDDYGLKWNTQRGLINAIEGIRVVNLIGNTVDASHLHDPTSDNLWFHVRCRNYSYYKHGRYFEFVTDGEKFIPVKSNGHTRLTSVTRESKYIDLSLMNQVDKKIIKFAIDQFINGDVCRWFMPRAWREGSVSLERHL